MPSTLRSRLPRVPRGPVARSTLATIGATTVACAALAILMGMVFGADVRKLFAASVSVLPGEPVGAIRVGPLRAGTPEPPGTLKTFAPSGDGAG